MRIYITVILDFKLAKDFLWMIHSALNLPLVVGFKIFGIDGEYSLNLLTTSASGIFHLWHPKIEEITQLCFDLKDTFFIQLLENQCKKYKINVSFFCHMKCHRSYCCTVESYQTDGK